MFNLFNKDKINDSDIQYFIDIYRTQYPRYKEGYLNKKETLVGLLYRFKASNVLASEMDKLNMVEFVLQKLEQNWVKQMDLQKNMTKMHDLFYKKQQWQISGLDFPSTRQDELTNYFLSNQYQTEVTARESQMISNDIELLKQKLVLKFPKEDQEKNYQKLQQNIFQSQGLSSLQSLQSLPYFSASFLSANDQYNVKQFMDATFKENGGQLVNDNYMSSLNSAVKNVRTENDYTQLQLAKQSQVTRDPYKMLFQRQVDSIDKLRLISDKLENDHHNSQKGNNFLESFQHRNQSQPYLNGDQRYRQDLNQSQFEKNNSQFSFGLIQKLSADSHDMTQSIMEYVENNKHHLDKSKRLEEKVEDVISFMKDEGLDSTRAETLNQDLSNSSSMILAESQVKGKKGAKDRDKSKSKQAAGKVLDVIPEEVTSSKKTKGKASTSKSKTKGKETESKSKGKSVDKKVKSAKSTKKEIPAKSDKKSSGKNTEKEKRPARSKSKAKPKKK